MITQIGDIISRVTQAVKMYGISPHSPVVVRVGDFGEEMLVEHVKVQGGLQPKLVLQCAKRQ